MKSKSNQTISRAKQHQVKPTQVKLNITSEQRQHQININSIQIKSNWNQTKHKYIKPTSNQHKTHHIKSNQTSTNQTQN